MIAARQPSGEAVAAYQEAMPLSSRLMLYVRPADLPLIAYQKWLEELGVPQI